MAKVIKAFPGVPDGMVYPVDYKPGDTVEGELARVALGEGWAEAEGKDEKAIAADARKESEAAAKAELEKAEAEKAEAERLAAQEAAKTAGQAAV